MMNYARCSKVISIITSPLHGRNFAVILAALAVLLTAMPVRAQEDAYVNAYNLIEKGDSLAASGRTDAAVAKYRQAQMALRDFQRRYPGVGRDAVRYRLNYTDDRIEALTKSAEESNGAQASASSSKGAAADRDAGMKMLSFGAEPRKLLRFHPQEGQKQSLQMTTKMAMTMRMDDTAMPQMTLPGINMAMDSTVTGISPEGDISYDIVITDVGVKAEPGAMEAAAAGIRSAMAGLKGSTYSGVVSSRGITKSTDFKMPSAADPQIAEATAQMKESLSRVVSPFPEEPVGVGARWEVRSPIKSQGMTLDQTATYEIVSIEGDRLTTKCTIAQRAANQKIQNAAMPGASVNLIKMVGSGTATSTSDLSQLMCSHSTVNERTDMTMAAMAGGKKQTINMQMTIGVEIESK